MTPKLSHRLRRGLEKSAVGQAGTIDVGVRFQLPSLRPSDIVLQAALTDIGSHDILRTLASAFRA
jgi:hypothetical protein